MANVDKPRGWWPCSIEGGGGYTPMRWYNNAGSEAIYQYDALTLSSGVVDPIDQGEATCGVSSQYSAATAGLDVYVYCDPAQQFEVQVDDGSLADATVMGGHYDVVATTGDTTTLISKQELDGDDSADDLFIVWDKCDRPNNAWGTNVDVYGIFLEHQGDPVANLAAQ